MSDTQASPEAPAPYSYDRIPYRSHPYPQTHPDRLSTLATLLGMEPAPIGAARVLELGCASGGNLLPLAAVLPGAEFVGVDLSSRQIADGRAVLEEAGLRNVRLLEMSLTEVEESFGLFDYILCHGVYSWVPDTVQERLLEVCRERLAPSGVAYVSYNTYPGWHMRGMIRDMMLYHTAQFEAPRDKVAQARALLDFLAESVRAREGDAYGVLLKSELDLMRRVSGSYLYHEHLEDVNEPIYFHQFAERAARKGLKYLGEAEFNTMLASNFAPRVAATLQRIARTTVRMEQYMDFVRNRHFRQTLLVHDGIRLKRRIGPEDVTELYVAGDIRSAAELDGEKLRSAERLEFTTVAGGRFSAAAPLVKAAFVVLGERWPEAVSVRDLLYAAAERAGTGGGASADPAAAVPPAFAQEVLRWFSAGFVLLHREPPPITVVPGQRPQATALARYQAASGRAVTSLRHRNVRLDGFSRRLLALLDGSRTRAELTEAMVARAAGGELELERDGRAVEDRTEMRRLMGDAVSRSLRGLGRLGLLVAAAGDEAAAGA